MLLTTVLCLLLTQLQSAETHKWVHFKEDENITYDVQDWMNEPEILLTDSTDVQPQFNKLIQKMEKDIEKFKAEFQKKIDQTVSRAHHSIQENVKMPRKPELQHQYGMLFNHQGYMMPGLQSLQLFLAIDLPKLEDLHHDPPAFPNCTNWAVPHPMHRDYYGTGGEYYIKWTTYKEMNESISFLNEAVHHKLCIPYQTKYNILLEEICTIKWDIEYKIKYVMPWLLPNKKVLIYGKETKTEHNRLKQAIPIRLIFSKVSAIGGLLIKGFNTISNYKKSKAMARAMKELYKTQEIDHKHHLNLLLTILINITQNQWLCFLTRMINYWLIFLYCCV